MARTAGLELVAARFAQAPGSGAQHVCAAALRQARAALPAVKGDDEASTRLLPARVLRLRRLRNLRRRRRLEPHKIPIHVRGQADQPQQRGSSRGQRD